MKRLATYPTAFCSMLALASTALAEEVAQSPGKTFGPEFWEKVVVALVSAFLAFTGSVVLTRIKKRLEERKQLSYDLAMRRGLVAIEEDIKNKVKVLYEGDEIQDLYHLACTIENTGNTVIKDQYLRFEFSPESRVVDAFLDPAPEPELSFAEAPTQAMGPHEKRYQIGHFERSQRVGFRFVLTGDSTPTVKLHPFNSSGDVEFVPRSVSTDADEAKKVSEFIVLYLLFSLLPSVFFVIPSDLGVSAAAVVRLVLIIPMVPRISPFAIAAARIIVRLARMTPTGSSINITNSGSLEQLYITSPKESDERSL